MYVSLSRGHDKAGRTDTLYDDLYKEAPPKRGSILRLQEYKRPGISQVVVYETVGKSVT